MIGYTFRTVRCTYHVFSGGNCVISAIGTVIWGPEPSRRARMANFFLIIYRIDQIKWVGILLEPSDVPTTCFWDVIESFRQSEQSYEGQSFPDGLEWQFLKIIFRIDHIKWLETLKEPTYAPTTCFHVVILLNLVSGHFKLSFKGLEWRVMMCYFHNQHGRKWLVTVIQTRWK